VALSNQFSLARMLKPTYPGTVGANTPEFRAWLAASQMPMFAWSSQAAGFFAGLKPGGFLAHAWFDDDNLERRRRAEQLAARRGSTPVTVALAWVLAQPGPIFPIVGPLSLRELRSTLAALHLALDPAEVAWLDLECDSPT
jgi:aryl-alcohol dehydrogenase-like predicted oxidoreductase